MIFQEGSISLAPTPSGSAHQSGYYDQTDKRPHLVKSSTPEWLIGLSRTPYWEFNYHSYIYTCAGIGNPLRKEKPPNRSFNDPLQRAHNPLIRRRLLSANNQNQESFVRESQTRISFFQIYFCLFYEGLGERIQVSLKAGHHSLADR